MQKCAPCATRTSRENVCSSMKRDCMRKRFHERFKLLDKIEPVVPHHVGVVGRGGESSWRTIGDRIDRVGQHRARRRRNRAGHDDGVGQRTASCGAVDDGLSVPGHLHRERHRWGERHRSRQERLLFQHCQQHNVHRLWNGFQHHWQRDPGERNADGCLRLVAHLGSNPAQRRGGSQWIRRFDTRNRSCGNDYDYPACSADAEWPHVHSLKPQSSGSFSVYSHIERRGTDGRIRRRRGEQ